jgi:hypothetical protein
LKKKGLERRGRNELLGKVTLKAAEIAKQFDHATPEEFSQ